MNLERIYADWIEPRSFGCKRCDFQSSNRKVVEQHLRLEHRELLDERAWQERVEETAPVAAAAAPKLGAPVTEARHAGEVIFYTDAGTWDNGTTKQRSRLAVWDSRSNSIVLDEELPGTTNNEAEYAAIIAALERAREERLSGVLVRSDSQLCVNQIKGQWQIKEERLRPLRDRAARLLKSAAGHIEWVPRERNHAGIYLERTKGRRS